MEDECSREERYILGYNSALLATYFIMVSCLDISHPEDGGDVFLDNVH